MEVSIILPALNEEKSIGKTISEIKKTLKNKTSYEIIVVDSDSEDRTALIARKSGAKVVNEPLRGYGNALRRGFKEAKGKYIIMYDPDGTYDADTIPRMVKFLDGGYDYVNANRFAKLTAKSMTLKNYIGNKILSFMGAFFFSLKGKDMLSGFKGFRRDAIRKMDLKAQKWDLNVEIHSKIKKKGLKFIEIPTRYFPRIGFSKLSGTTAAWNTFRYMLLYSPNFVLIYPSIFLILISTLAAIINLMSNRLGNVSLLLSAMIFIIGLQMLLFGIMSKTYLFKRGFDNRNVLNEIGAKLTIEKGIIVSLIIFIISFFIFLTLVLKWFNSNKILELSDIKLGIVGFTLMMAAISIFNYSFINQTLNE